MFILPRIGNIAKTAIQSTASESIVPSRFVSGRRRRREDCQDLKKGEKKEEKKEVKGKEPCVDLNFKKVEVNIYDYNECLPPRRRLDKDCSTVKARKVSCHTKKRNIPTGCRKFSMYTDIQNKWSQGTNYRSRLNKIQIVDLSVEDSKMPECPMSIDPLRELPKDSKEAKLINRRPDDGPSEEKVESMNPKRNPRPTTAIPNGLQWR